MRRLVAWCVRAVLTGQVVCGVAVLLWPLLHANIAPGISGLVAIAYVAVVLGTILSLLFGSVAFAVATALGAVVRGCIALVSRNATAIRPLPGHGEIDVSTAAAPAPND